jgi:hypothetical protein
VIDPLIANNPIPAGAPLGAVTVTTVNGVAIMVGTADPSAGGGVAHLHPAVYYRTGTVQVWRSTSATATDWLRLVDHVLPTIHGPTFSATTALPYQASFDCGIAEESYVEPAEISSDQTNWAPWGSVDFRRINRIIVTSDAAGRAINSLVAPGYRAAYWIVNGNSDILRTIPIRHEHGGSTAANRFVCPGLVDRTLLVGGAVFVWYDTAAARHRVAG